MSNENNKMQFDIENLFKQNVNDLTAIKELYRKLNEVEEKFSQIKYIDSTLANRLKKEYEKLKKIILDENIQVNLTYDIEKINKKLKNDIETINKKINNDIETINSHLETKANKDDTDNKFTTLTITKAEKNTTDSLQSQINDLVLNSGGDSNLEVVQSRTNSVGSIFYNS